MLHLKLKEDQREEGFTLIELLIVVVIIGILAAIAIPSFLSQRESAWEASAESDVRNAAAQVETFIASGGNLSTAVSGTISSPNPGEAIPLSDGSTTTNIQASDDVSLTVTGDANGYTITATHQQIDSGGTTVATYDSTQGGLQ